MKTIIISDIKGHSESIIPYGLRIGRQTEAQVEILHVIDSRQHHGVSSPYADSGSISPGGKLSHERILQREKNKASLAIENMLSAEASRLNYPLKINVNVSTDLIKRAIATAVNSDPEPLLVASMEPGNSMLSGLNEMLSIIHNMHQLSLFIPPEYSFGEIENAVLFTDFSDKGYARFREIIKWFLPFRPVFTALGMAKKTELMTMEQHRRTWEKLAQEYTGSSLKLKTTVIDKKSKRNPLLKYVKKNKPHIVILPRNFLQYGLKRLIIAEKPEKVVKSFKRPVLIY